MLKELMGSGCRFSAGCRGQGEFSSFAQGRQIWLGVMKQDACLALLQGGALAEVLKDCRCSRKLQQRVSEAFIFLMLSTLCLIIIPPVWALTSL